MRNPTNGKSNYCIQMSLKTRSLLLFTEDYPYDDSERSFLKEEIKYLAKSFHHVYIVPMKTKDIQKYELPENVTPIKDVSIALNNITGRQKLKGITSRDFIAELSHVKFSKTKLKLALAKNLAAVAISDWLKSFVNMHASEDFVIYSFWFNECALGGVKFNRKIKATKVVSRCHNFDLYGNEENDYYVPYQKLLMKELDAIFPVSQDGADYLFEKFGRKVNPAFMGVADPKAINEASKDNILRIVSCSYVLERKRLHLIATGLVEYCNAHSDKKVDWTHLGGGPEQQNIENILKAAPENLSHRITGAMSNDDVHNYYKQNPVDLFINSSAKEGTPVSIMEAISYGIPILATGFGGNREVVEKGAGFLLPIDPTDADFKRVLEEFAGGNHEKLRASSRNVWDKYYNADTNSIKFSSTLLNL